MARAEATLWHIVISHYSEKVRWALQHKRVQHERHAPPPGAHIPVALWLTRGRQATFPVLELDGRRIGDSTAIIAALEQRFPQPALYPEDPAERARALALEDFFDEELGPHARRLAFYEFRRDRERFGRVAAEAAPALARMGRAGEVFGRAFTGLRYRAGAAEGAEAAKLKIAAAMDRLEAELAPDGYLVGGRFTVADLSAAALFFPLVLPPEGPLPADDLPEPYAEFRASLADRPGFAWVQEMFRRHRS